MKKLSTLALATKKRTRISEHHYEVLTKILMKEDFAEATRRVCIGAVLAEGAGIPLTPENITKVALYSENSKHLVSGEIQKLVNCNVLTEVECGLYAFADKKNWFKPRPNPKSEVQNKLLQDLKTIEEMKKEIQGKLKSLKDSEAA